MDLYRIQRFPTPIFSAIFIIVSVFGLFSIFNGAHAATESIAIIRENCANKSIPTANCYTALSLWEAAENRNLVTADQIAIAQIEGAWTSPDTTPVTINGWTTDATHYVKIYTTSEARHTGKWDNIKYRLESGNWGAHIIDNQQNYTRIEGLQILHSGGGDSSSGIYSVSYAGVVVKDAIVKKTSTSIGEGIKIVGTSAGSSGVVNSVAYGGWNFGINIATFGGYGYAYNTTSYGNNYGYNGFYVQNLKNCIGASNSIADFARDVVASYSVFTTACASSDATANIFTDTGSRINQTFSFVNPAAGDFHLSSSDTAAKDFGTNLSADSIYAFSTDVDGQTRSGTWDIGADEYQQGGATPPPPPVITDTSAPSISAGAPTSTLPSTTTQTTLSVTTDENATCKYSATANTSYAALTNTFTGA
ncbi:MAG: hypothetical protein NUV61_00870, partial [Candidatus Azambacteria bacterium]|nr:hypothetical protein [Candidatus Azambacteria bacterium]